ncbi:MAG: hypothetical protein HY841_02275 [Bacteroidetes bacterium]|nr:hypothetical protein [Bacteroidota bacterium]
MRRITNSFFYLLTVFSVRLAFLFLLPTAYCLLPTAVYSQTWVMPVDGKVMVGSQRALGSVITLFKNGKQQQQVVTTSNGKFSFELAPNAEYLISVTKPGYVTKKFKIVTANVPADRAEGGNFNPFEPDVTLFEMPTAPEIAKRVEAILSQPIAIYQYIPSENNFNYDEKYTQAIQSKLSELADLQKQVEKEMADKAKNAAVEAQKQLELDNKYKAAIAKADKAFGSADYSTAKMGYNEALGVKPAEAYPKQKLAEIDKLLANANAQKEIDAKYKAAITKGDGAFTSKDYASAKTSYTEASGIKPSEQYPKTKLAEIEKLLADADKQKEVDEKYKAAIAKGDNAFGTKDYTTAKAGFTEASYIKPAEQYPKTKIAEIDKLLADASKQKEIDEKYKAAIAKGDAAFGTKDYASSKTAFTEATGIKPAEQYPKTKLAELDKLLGDAAKQKEIDTKYQAAITKGDNAFKAKDYVTSKAGFNEAIGVKPNEPYPKQMLGEIDKLLADAANAAKQIELDEKYKAAIAKGDGAFTSKDYTTARAGYTEATGIKPSEPYPKTKLAEIDKLLGDAAKQKEIESKYQAAITKGDNAFNAKDYSAAKAGYTEASGIKPSEQYPKTKLAEIEKLIADAASAAKQKEIDDKYKAAIAKGDGAFTSKDYSTARAGYTEASGIKPSEQYPKTKLAEIDKLLGAAEAEKQKEQQYKDAIAKADAAFETKNYAGAKNSYTQASTIKPSEQYPKTKIAEIDKLLADLAAQKSAAEKDKLYSDAIAKADKLFNAKDYSNSKSAYNEALGVKPAEQYPKQRIAEIDKILADLDAQKSNAAKQKEIDDKYKAAIATGDNGFNSKDYTAAKAGYTEASGIKPLEQYPKNKLAEIDKILKDLASKNAADKTLNDNYLSAVMRGDFAFKEQTFANAKASYNEALTYKPDEQYPKDKLAEIEKIEKARGEAQASNNVLIKYNQCIDRGDKAFGVKDYLRAKPAYEEALTYKPNEKYPKQRLTQIESLLKAALLAQNTKPKDKTPVISEEEKKKVYQSELRAKYPNGVTEEEFSDNGKVVLRRVVIKDDFAGVYTKVTHNWGGIYCFKDNTPITEITFENETK